MVTGDWQLLTAVCLWCCGAFGHPECMCVCLWLLGCIIARAYGLLLLLWTAAHSVYLEWKNIPSACGCVCVCGGRICIWMRIYVWIDVCVYTAIIWSFIPLYMLLHTRITLINAIIYSHSYYRGYYILAFSPSML